MAAPTKLPSAKTLSGKLAKAYETITGNLLPATLHENLEELARHIWRNDQLTSLFINRLMDWRPFQRNPNNGHKAIADFLLCGGFEIAISTNYDTHIEDAAYDLGEGDFVPALDGDEVQTTPSVRKPLLKIHGCCHRDRNHTVWLQEQLHVEPISARIELSRTWIRSNLRQRDIVFVGFWSDWAYLNSLLEEVIVGLPGDERRTVVLVDPATVDVLKAKAPSLSSWAEESSGVSFFHVQESGSQFLDSLRVELSLQFLRRLLHDSTSTYQRLSGSVSHSEPSLGNVSDGSEGLYNLRRDLTGVVPSEPIRTLSTEKLEIVGAILSRFLILGAVLNGGVVHFGGETYRIFNGAGRLMSDVKSVLLDTADVRGSVDTIVCVGAFPDPTPADILRPDSSATIMRPTVAQNWKTENDLDIFQR